MEKNVGSVDLAELMKAREEMNRDMGIATDPDMYKNYNPNRQQEEAETINEAENEANASVESNEALQDFSVQENEDETTEPKLNPVSENESSFATNGERDFSVYDSFADFEIAENATKKPQENAENVSQNQTRRTSENAENNSDFGKNDNKISDDYLSDTLASLDEFLVANSDTEKTENISQNLEKPAEKIVPPMPANSEQSPEASIKDLEELLGFSDFSLGGSSTYEQKQSDFTLAQSDNFEPKSEIENSVNEPEQNIVQIKNEPNLENVQESEPVLTNLKADNDGYWSNGGSEDLEMLQELLGMTSYQSGSENAYAETEKYAEGLNASEQDSEEKIRAALANLNISRPEVSRVEQTKVSEFAYKTIKGSDFVDIIGLNEFKNLDKLSFVLGTNEQGEYQFASLSGMYNVALFSKDEKSANKFFNCLMLSLMLKNNYNDVKFYIADTQVNSVFKKYNNSAYLGAKVSTNYDDVLSLLTSLMAEIDERYETIASAGLRNVEEYNKAMEESHIIGYPYSILIFNNYANLSSIETYNKIKECLSYILKFGRLVGVYAYIKAGSEIADERINYNLATRIAYRANSEEESVKMVGDEGAERLAGEDEFVFKTIYLEELMHLKTPNITDREIELLIQNIEG